MTKLSGSTHYLYDVSLVTINRKEIDLALDVFKAGPYHKHEVARSTWLKSQIIRKMGKIDTADALKRTVVQLRVTLVQEVQVADELTDADFDSLTIFWSR